MVRAPLVPAVSGLKLTEITPQSGDVTPACIVNLRISPVVLLRNVYKKFRTPDSLRRSANVEQRVAEVGTIVR